MDYVGLVGYVSLVGYSIFFRFWKTETKLLEFTLLPVYSAISSVNFHVTDSYFVVNSHINKFSIRKIKPALVHPKPFEHLLFLILLF